MTKIVGIFTGKDLKEMQREGGSGYWVARTDRIMNAEYILLMRNLHASWSVIDNVKHGQAFMIGKISGCVTHGKRKIIQMSDYALLPDLPQFEKAWKKLTDGQRYPVAYLETDDLQRELELDVASLEWLTFEPEQKVETPIDNETISESSDLELSEVIADAKEMIAHAANVSIDKVNIQISF